jgi:hypothetical protein
MVTPKSNKNDLLLDIPFASCEGGIRAYGSRHVIVKQTRSLTLQRDLLKVFFLVLVIVSELRVERTALY